MKVMIALIALIVTGGIGAGYIAYQHQQQSSDEIRNEILSAVNNLKQQDSTTNTVILESRYGLRTDYDALAERVRDLRQSTSAFNRNQLAEYAGKNADIQQLLIALQGQLTLKIELIESFKSHNAILRNSIKYAPELGEKLIRQARVKNNAQAVSQLSLVNEALYRWALHGDNKEASVIQENASSLVDLYNAVINGVALIRYANHVGTVVEEQEITQGFIDKILAIDSQSTIAKLESEYLEHYVSVIKASEKNLYFVFLYAILVLIIAVYLGIKLKKSYAELKNRDDYRSQQISVAHRHLNSADANVSILKETVDHMKETLRYLGGISTEAQKPQKDNQKIRTLLATALKRYRLLENNRVLDQADDVIEKSNQNLERVSDLVKDLAVN